MKRNLFAGQRRSGGIGLTMFSDDELRMIHRGTLVVLERTGIWVELDEALDIFSDGGCRVDRESHIVKIPPHIVEDAIASAPEAVALCGRDPKNDILLEPGRVGFSNFGEGIKVIDPYTGELRPSTKKDLGEIARLVDALPDIDVFEMAVVCGDQPPETFSLHNHEAAIVNQTKPISGGAQDGRAVHTTVEMLAAVQGGDGRGARAPHDGHGHLPGEPAQAGQGLLRDRHRGGARRACRPACSAWPWPAARRR